MVTAEPTEPAELELLSTREVAARSGASYRKIDYWTRLGLLVPEVAARGSGSYRGYSHAELRAARALECCVRLGIVPTSPLAGVIAAGARADVAFVQLSGVFVDLEAFAA